MSQKRTRPTYFFVLCGILLVLIGAFPSALGEESWLTLLRIDRAWNQTDYPLSIHFLDVGQGDSVLIQSGEHAMLVDGGERGSEGPIIRYLKQKHVTTLDYVVATHPHSDHIGGLAYGVLEAFPVGLVIAPKLSQKLIPTTQTYEKFLTVLDALRFKGTQATFAVPGTVYALGDVVTFQILGPMLEEPKHLNDTSVVVKVACGTASALLTGDAETAAENALLHKWDDTLQAELLKAGHHGSRTSSQPAFLQVVQPRYMVISCGAGNSYGHPHPKVLKALREREVQIFRTDIQKTCVFISDGVQFFPFSPRVAA